MGYRPLSQDEKIFVVDLRYGFVFSSNKTFIHYETHRQNTLSMYANVPTICRIEIPEYDYKGYFEKGLETVELSQWSVETRYVFVFEPNYLDYTYDPKNLQYAYSRTKAFRISLQNNAVIIQKIIPAPAYSRLRAFETSLQSGWEFSEPSEVEDAIRRGIYRYEDCMLSEFPFDAGLVPDKISRSSWENLRYE